MCHMPLLTELRKPSLAYKHAAPNGATVDFADELPAGVIVIDAPALGMQERLDKFRMADVLRERVKRHSIIKALKFAG